jgi:hypothetical protein
VSAYMCARSRVLVFVAATWRREMPWACSAAEDPDAGALFGVVVYSCVEDEGEVVDGRWGHVRCRG